jgi:hypothetical protein
LNYDSETAFLHKSTDRIIVNDELGRIRKEVVMIYFKVLTQTVIGGAKKSGNS